MAHTADCLLPYISHGLEKSEFIELARCIAFHELNEVVLGDIPTYTSLTPVKRNESRNYAEERLRSVDPMRRKHIANEFVWLFLNEKHRISLLKVNENLSINKLKSNLYIIFKTFDKIDPIITCWRYLYHYRGLLGDNPRFFNHRLKDFYENPDVKAFLVSNKVDHLVLDLVNFLQDRTNAWDYYVTPEKVFKNNELFSLPVKLVKRIIEDVPLLDNE